jgi:hypothetical protein
MTRAFAGGCEIKETPEQLMARMAQKYGAAPVAETQTAPVVQPAPQQAKPQSAGGIIGLLKGRHAMIDKAAGYANGGKIKGPGTPTSDSIAAKVRETGEPIKVSTDERILSKDQDNLMQKIMGGLELRDRAKAALASAKDSAAAEAYEKARMAKAVLTKLNKELA